MTWFAFQGLNGGKAVDLAGTQEKQAVAEGFHGYATEAQAEAQPNSVNLVTRVFADAWIADYNAAVREKAQPGGANADITNPGTAASAGASYVESYTPFASIEQALTAFYDVITNVKMWRSLGWLVLGLALMFTGIGLWLRVPQRAAGIAGAAARAAI